MRSTPTTRTPARRLLLAVAAATLAAAPVAKPEPMPTDLADRQADAALAERIEGLAAATFPIQIPTGKTRAFVFGQQAALLSAAATLNPSEGRYPRKVAEALGEIGDVPGQINALTLAILANRQDEFSWVQSLDLHVADATMQTAADRLKYLDGIITNPGVPTRVRAHALFRKALIQLDQGKESAGRSTLGEALLSNPLSVEALRVQYATLGPDTTLTQRASVLTGLLMANPVQPAYAAVLADLLANAGLVDESLPFYQLSVGAARATGDPDPQVGMNWAAALYLANRPADAHDLIGGVIGARPDFSAARYLQLVIDRDPGGRFPQGQYGQDLQAVMVAMTNRVATAVNAVADLKLAGGPAVPRATTMPANAAGDVVVPDVDPATAAILRRKAGAMTPVEAVVRRELVESVADLARLQIYFAGKPAVAAPLLASLRKLLGDSDPLVAQLQGWSDLAAGNDKAAQNTLLTIAKDDPLANLGVAKLLAKQPPQADQADAIGRKLLQDHPAGLIGAMVADGLRDRRLRVQPPVQAVPLKQVANQFPQALAQGVMNPPLLYQLHFEPVDVGRDVGQPLVAEVTITNFGPSDLTIGPDGFLHRGLLFQAAAVPIVPGGPPPQSFPAFDQWAGPMVLPRNQMIHQRVRLDQQAGLQVALDQVAGQAVQVEAQVQTNPDAPLGGYGVRMTKRFARTAANGVRAEQALRTVNANGGPGASSPADRLTDLGVLQAYAKQLRAARNPAPNLVQTLQAIDTTIHRARRDPDRAVAAWAAEAEFALATTDDARARLIRDMANDRDNFRTRQLALLLASFVADAGAVKDVVAQLADDPQPNVRALAEADHGLLEGGAPLVAKPPPPKPAANGVGVPPPPPGGELQVPQ